MNRMIPPEQYVREFTERMRKLERSADELKEMQETLDEAPVPADGRKIDGEILEE